MRHRRAAPQRPMGPGRRSLRSPLFGRFKTAGMLGSHLRDDLPAALPLGANLFLIVVVVHQGRCWCPLRWGWSRGGGVMTAGLYRKRNSIFSRSGGRSEALGQPDFSTRVPLVELDPLNAVDHFRYAHGARDLRNAADGVADAGGGSDEEHAGMRAAAPHMSLGQYQKIVILRQEDASERDRRRQLRGVRSSKRCLMRRGSDIHTTASEALENARPRTRRRRAQGSRVSPMASRHLDCSDSVPEAWRSSSALRPTRPGSRPGDRKSRPAPREPAPT